MRVWERISQKFSLYGVAGVLFVYSTINFLLLVYNLIFSDGAEAWSYFGKGIMMLFVGLIILGFTGPQPEKSS